MKDIETKLDDFKLETRQAALVELKEKIAQFKPENSPTKGFVNQHCHTFFSYNGYGYSPSHVAWHAYREGWDSVGIVDFDVLDGIAEILEAGELLGIRATAGMETRVFVKDYADKVINSPKEPGVYYYTGSGFYRQPEAGSEAEKTLFKMKDIAKSRNLAMIEKINNHLRAVQVDYDKDVIPYTPQGNATERHLLEAYDRKAREVFGSDISGLVSFWAEKLGLEEEKVNTLLEDVPNMQELIRSKLMKYGGVGYSTPDSKTFPSFEEVTRMIETSDALPTITWLDGTSDGESDAREFVKFMLENGSVLLNIIPDRNWNIKDEETRKIKVAKLNEIVSIARQLNIPMIAGTEMNKFGQKHVDDFTVPELAPYLEDFRNGAFFVYGHIILAKYCQKGYNSHWSRTYLPDRVKRNEFCTRAGVSVNPGSVKNLDMVRLGEDLTPDEVLDLLEKG